MKKILTKIIGWFGYKLVEKKLIKNNRIISRNSYLNIFKILEFIFSSKNIQTVVQIGSNDGDRFDQLNLFLKKYKTKAILVEPVKEYFNKLKLNYDNQKNIIFENIAISSDSKRMFLYTVDQNYLGKYDEHIAGVTSFNKNHLLKHGVKNQHIIKLEVNCSTIKQLLKKYHFDNLDLLFIDTEGYEGVIVDNFLNDCDLNTIIIFEYIHLEDKVFESLIEQLKNKKYNFFPVEENLVCFPKNHKILL